MTSIDHKTKYINSVLNQIIDTKQNTKETTSKNRLKLLKKLHNKTKKNNYDDTMLVCKTCKTKFKSFTGGDNDEDISCLECLDLSRDYAYITGENPVEDEGQCINKDGISEWRKEKNREASGSGRNWSAITDRSACKMVNSIV